MNDDTINKDDLENVEDLQKRRNTIYSVKFEEDPHIALGLNDVSFKPCRLITELKDFKCMIFLAVFSACILGILTPLNGFIMAK